MASLLEGLLEARDFVLQARDAAGDGKVINEEDGPDGEISGHQAIEISHLASDFLGRKNAVDFVDARKLLMPMTFARGNGFFRLDNTS
jgi:hypothetical protein